jgi:hypothetical protein
VGLLPLLIEPQSSCRRSAEGVLEAQRHLSSTFNRQGTHLLQTTTTYCHDVCIKIAGHPTHLSPIGRLSTDFCNHSPSIGGEGQPPQPWPSDQNTCEDDRCHPSSYPRRSFDRSPPSPKPRRHLVQESAPAIRGHDRTAIRADRLRPPGTITHSHILNNTKTVGSSRLTTTLSSHNHMQP